MYTITKKHTINIIARSANAKRFPPFICIAKKVYSHGIKWTLNFERFFKKLSKKIKKINITLL